jgi:hypothetical protein
VANLIVSAVSTFDNRGLKKGQKEISNFDKNLKKLGKTFAGVFGAQALYNYGKNAIKAFMADEKAAKSLEQQLKNTGYAFAAPSVEYYIANLQKVTGVLDDELRPAFQQLLTASGSITKSQEALNTALNISAATGKSLTEVSAALSRGFAGNTTGLSRLGAGLSKATLKTGNMEKILAELNQKFSGQAAARLDTYAGKMDLLKVSAANASEIIGKGLLDSLQALSKDNSIENTGKAMENLATEIANATYGMALLIAKTKEFLGLGKGDFGGGGALTWIPLVGPLLDKLSKYGGAELAKPKSNFTYSLGPSAIKDVERADAILKGNKERAKELKLLKEKNALEALKIKYDVERAGLMKALNEATDEETRLRIAEKLALLDGNAAKAQQYLADLALNQTLGLLTNSTANAALGLNNFATDITKFGPALLDAAGNLTARALNQLLPVYMLNPQYVPQSVPQAAQSSTPTVGVTVNAGTIITDQQLESVIQQNVLTLLKSGNKLLPAGSL